MKKKIWIVILTATLLLAVLFVPIPISPARDGGSREYAALTYKLVNWNRVTDYGTYTGSKLYLFPNNFKSLDELWTEEEQAIVHSFTATILELDENTALIQPVAGEEELQSCDQFRIDLSGLEDISAKVGTDVIVCYTGGVMETYPAQINVHKWELATDLRHRAYSGQWLDPEAETTISGNLQADMVITEIYADCFIARAVIPLPYRYARINGTLSQEWCVGDQVLVSYENQRIAGDKMEADLLSVEVSSWQPQEGVYYKPVIYLYPEEKTDVSVTLALDGRLTCTYPAYRDGWRVTAAPDGTLTDQGGQTYNYLYWEGETNVQWTQDEGFCVKGADTASFLEDALAQMGLTRREANEFIVYWLPKMEQNPYNLITFQTDRYTQAAELKVSPAPDTTIRIFMTWQASNEFVSLPTQTLSSPTRTGFTVVEWGGTELTN